MAKLDNGDSGATARGIINSLIAPPLIAVSVNKTLGASDMQTRQSVSTGATDLTLALPSAATYPGESVYVRKSDTGAGKVIVENGVGLAHLYVQNDSIVAQSDGTDWVIVAKNIAPLIENFITTGTWNKPPLATQHLVRVIGGGASGARGNVGSSITVARGGGGGGAGGAYAEAIFRSDLLSSSVLATCGLGGAARPAGTGAGVAGAPGGETSFGTHLVAQGGLAGTAPTTTGTAGASPLGLIGGGIGGASGANGGAGAAPINATTALGTNLITGGGGAAAGLTNSNAQSAGGAGAAGGRYYRAGVLGGTGGAAGGGNGLDGTSQPVDFANGFGGGGGGGGGGSAAGADGGAGGNGGFPGGGGGGSGAAATGFLSGSSGAGGAGAVQIVTYF